MDNLTDDMEKFGSLGKEKKQFNHIIFLNNINLSSG